MDSATALRLLTSARQTCIIINRDLSVTDENENPLPTDETPSAPLVCFFTTPQSFRRAEVSTAEEEELTITHQIYLPGDAVIDRNAAITDIRRDRGLAGEVVLSASTMEVVRLDESMRPFIVIGNLHEVA